ncbi:carbohydrate sulfotransferase 13-like isoform X1 [Penaeus indicus]|uniref:carbohydrate sulfotransferase 13-like isoform X1 n=1 Tax=Penaeus indicus TaxID=29960 RepID=UPI00300C1A91
MRASRLRLRLMMLLSSLLALAIFKNTFISSRFLTKYMERRYQTWSRNEFEISDLKMKSVTTSEASTRRVVSHLDDSRYSPIALRERALAFSNTSNLVTFLVEQERRKHQVAAVCQENREPSSNDRPLYLVHDSKHSLTYCPIYKAASTSWSVLLLQMAGVTKSEAENLQVLLEKVFPREPKTIEYKRTRNTTKFVVVRHPLDRLASTYRDKYQNANKPWYYINYGQEMVRMFRAFPKQLTKAEVQGLQYQVAAKIQAGQPVALPGNPFADPLGPTFREFALFVVASRHADPHWMEFHDQCAVCNFDYDFILKFENLHGESEQFLDYLDRGSEATLQRRNSGRKPSSSSADTGCSFFDQISVRLIGQLVAKYEKDFQLFEYSPDEYYKCASDYTKLH